MKKAIFLCGVSGSGKTTFRKTLPKTYKTVNNDELKLTTQQLTQYIHEIILSGKPFIYDGTCRDRKNMLERMNDAKEHGYKIVLIILYVPLKTSIERIKKRVEQPVPEPTIIEIYKHLTKTVKEYLKLDFIDDMYFYDNQNDSRLIYHKKKEKIEFLLPNSEFYVNL